MSITRLNVLYYWREMARKLNKDLEDLLLNRVYIARTLQVFTYYELAQGFALSRSSFNRYISPTYRAQSQEDARRALLLAKNIDKSKCWRCKASLRKHLRCADCTILLHAEARMSKCASCVGTLVRKTIREYQFTTL